MRLATRAGTAGALAEPRRQAGRYTWVGAGKRSRANWEGVRCWWGGCDVCGRLRLGAGGTAAGREAQEREAQQTGVMLVGGGRQVGRQSGGIQVPRAGRVGSIFGARPSGSCHWILCRRGREAEGGGEGRRRGSAAKGGRLQAREQQRGDTSQNGSQGAHQQREDTSNSGSQGDNPTTPHRGQARDRTGTRSTLSPGLAQGGMVEGERDCGRGAYTQCAARA